MKRIASMLLNIILLLSVIPTIVFSLLDLIAAGRINLSSSAFGLGLINFTLFGLATWHLFVWEHRIEIRRKQVLFVVRAIKAMWICAMPFLLALPTVPPLKTIIPYFIGGAAYAVLRNLFARPLRI